MPQFCLGVLLFRDHESFSLFLVISPYFLVYSSCFLDSFDIGAAAFLEISISNSVFYIWNLMGSILESMAQFPYLDFNYVILWPQMETNIKIEFSGSICHVNSTRKSNHQNTTQIWTLQIFIAGFLQIFCIYLIRKEAIDNIKIDLRSRNDALSSDEHFPF